MDERNRYNKIKKLLKPIVGTEIHMDKLKRRVMIDIGSSDAVVRESIGFMMSLGLIYECKPWVFKVVRCEADI